MHNSLLKFIVEVLLIPILLLYGTISSATTPIDTEKLIKAEIATLDNMHQEFSNALHRKLLGSNINKFSKVKSIKQLNIQVQDLVEQDQPVAAANLILFHIPYLENNYDNLAIFDYIALLLDQNELIGANKLFTLLKDEGDKTLYSNAAFHFTRHYFKRNNWDKVLSLLKTTINDLAPAEHHKALFMRGVALQHKLNHRDAIKSYSKIPPVSDVYVPARLNLAIANIRLGWWTDAHIIINDILNSKLAGKNEESINRLYLTLGYSLLYKEYYRNSREAFRNVGLKSRYTNRALLGLAITAANQEDFIGALNAVRVLKNSVAHDLTTDESYFLMPYLYEKLQQHTTASAGYTEAINYYDNQISHIHQIMNTSDEMYKYALKTDNKGRIKFDNILLDLSDKYPAHVIYNYLKLDSYLEIIEKLGDKNITTKFDSLQNKYAAVIHSMINSLLQQRIKYLNSYKDQSRYGLARLYDNKLATNN